MASNNDCWIKKIRRGMVLEFDDGLIDIVTMTGHFGKSHNHPEKKGRYFISTTQLMVMYWPNMPAPKILGWADKKDMKRINRINKLVKADNQKLKAKQRKQYGKRNQDT